MAAINTLAITASSLVNAAGLGKAATLTAMQKELSGLRNCGYPGLMFDTWLGKVNEVEEAILEAELQRFNCRNNLLAKMALDQDGFRNAVKQAVARYGADRIGVFMGTSTSGCAATEDAYAHRDPVSHALPASFDMLHTHNIASAQAYVQHSLGLPGIGLTISTACSSSAKVFAAAHRYITSGLCDAAVVGGVDSLCLTTLYGFHSLQLVSPQPCRPWDQARQGINIGEAAGFALLEKTSNTPDQNNYIKLKGYGESSDAYHMSTPHPQGDGAVIAMQKALQRAGLDSDEIDYVNLHGTATPSNDAAEAHAIARVFTHAVACSSTKGITGHTLGAAGITEAIICAMALEQGLLPANVNLEQADLTLPVDVLSTTQERPLRHVMSNSFGFGGSNCSLVLGW